MPTLCTSHGKFSVRFILASTALIYLLLPNLLFLAGWVVPHIAVPLMIGLSAAAVFVLVHARRETAHAPLALTPKDYFSFLVTALLTLVWVEMLGVHGHVVQCGDWIHRTPMYEAFCDGNIPLYDDRGRYVIYYHAFWLPPAYLYRLMQGAVSRETILFLWYAAGLILAEAVLFTRLKKRILPYTAILFCFGSILHWLNVLSPVPPALQDFLDHADKSHALETLLALLCMGRTYLQTSSNIISSPSHGIAIVLTMSLLLSRLLPRRYNAYVAALALVMCPLNALMLIPILLTDVWRDRKRFIPDYLCNFPVWAATFSLIPVCAFFLCQESSSETAFVFSNSEIAADYHFFQYRHEIFTYPWARTAQATIDVLCLLLPCYFLLDKKIRRSYYFIAAVFIAVFLHCCLIARNELIFKGSIPMFMLLSMLFTIQLKRCSVKKRLCIYLFILLSASHVFGDVIHRHWWDYSWDDAVISRNIKRGSLKALSPAFYGVNQFPMLLK